MPWLKNSSRFKTLLCHQRLQGESPAEVNYSCDPANPLEPPKPWKIRSDWKMTKIGNENWTQTFFSQTFRAPRGYPGKIPGYPAKKVWFPWFRGAYRTFWPPTPSCGRPLPHRKIFGLKSLGLGSFFVPDKKWLSGLPQLTQQWPQKWLCGPPSDSKVSLSGRKVTFGVTLGVTLGEAPKVRF